MIRVLHVVHTMDCGGIETMLMNVYRKIDRNEIQFDFLVNGDKESYYTDEIISLGGKVLNVTPKRKGFFKNLRETINYMKQGNYKIVHIHQDSMIAPAIWCAKKAGIKYIITHAHTTNADVWFRKIATKIGRYYINKNADLKFACSAAAAKWIYGKNISDFVLFNNAIDAKKCEYSEAKYNSNRKEMNIKNGEIVIGTCGRLSVEKNQKFLVEVFSELKKEISSSKLLLVGDGPERKNIEELAKQLGVFDDIIFTGLVSNVDYYYSVMDCFLLPSFYEGLPLVGVEAQAAGLPTIFSTGVTNEIKIIDNVHFLDLNDGAKIWADKIESIIKKREKTYDMIKKAGYDIASNVELLTEKYTNYSIEGKE